MSFVLDTNICSAHFRRPGGLAHRFIQYGGGLFVSSVVVAELYAGAYHVANPSTLLAKIADLLTDVAVLDFDIACGGNSTFVTRIVRSERQVLAMSGPSKVCNSKHVSVAKRNTSMIFLNHTQQSLTQSHVCPASPADWFSPVTAGIPGGRLAALRRCMNRCQVRFCVASDSELLRDFVGQSNSSEAVSGSVVEQHFVGC